MISNLIQPPAIKKESKPTGNTDTYDIVQKCARLFVNGMGGAQRDRFKTMLQHGAECGDSVARAYGVPLEEFVAEVKKII